MSKPFWPDQLAQMLQRLRPPDRPLRVAVVGIGHELRGDDAAGSRVACALQPRSHDLLLVVDAGPAPENCTGPLRRFAPDLVLLIDAAQMNASPGTIEWQEWRAADGCGASTHTLSVALLASYLTAELGCEVALLGIQPANTAVGAPLSTAIQQAIDILARRLGEVLV